MQNDILKLKKDGSVSKGGGVDFFNAHVKKAKMKKRGTPVFCIEGSLAGQALYPVALHNKSVGFPRGRVEVEVFFQLLIQAGIVLMQQG
jgi:hypothetical protein